MAPQWSRRDAEVEELKRQVRELTEENDKLRENTKRKNNLIKKLNDKLRGWDGFEHVRKKLEEEAKKAGLFNEEIPTQLTNENQTWLSGAFRSADLAEQAQEKLMNANVGGPNDSLLTRLGVLVKHATEMEQKAATAKQDDTDNSSKLRKATGKLIRTCATQLGGPLVTELTRFHTDVSNFLATAPIDKEYPNRLRTITQTVRQFSPMGLMARIAEALRLQEMNLPYAEDTSTILSHLHQQQVPSDKLVPSLIERQKMVLEQRTSIRRAVKHLEPHHTWMLMNMPAIVTQNLVEHPDRDLWIMSAYFDVDISTWARKITDPMPDATQALTDNASEQMPKNSRAV